VGKYALFCWPHLREEPNPVSPDTSHGAAEVVAPQGVRSFILQPGFAYLAQVCGRASKRSCREAAIQLESQRD